MDSHSTREDSTPNLDLLAELPAEDLEDPSGFVPELPAWLAFDAAAETGEDDGGSEAPNWLASAETHPEAELALDLAESAEPAIEGLANLDGAIRAGDAAVEASGDAAAEDLSEPAWTQPEFFDRILEADFAEAGFVESAFVESSFAERAFVEPGNIEQATVEPSLVEQTSGAPRALEVIGLAPPPAEGLDEAAFVEAFVEPTPVEFAGFGAPAHVEAAEPTPVEFAIVAPGIAGAAWVDAAAEPVAEASAPQPDAAKVLESVIREMDESMAEPEEVQGAPSPDTAVAAARYVVFYLGASSFALPIENVLEMGTAPRVTPVPGVAHFVRGVTNLRGEVLSVLDLRGLLGLDRSANAFQERMLVVRSGDEDSTAAFMVDRVRGLTRLAEKSVVAPGAGVDDGMTRFLRGVCEHEDRLLNVLDARKVFESREMRELSHN